MAATAHRPTVPVPIVPVEVAPLETEGFLQVLADDQQQTLRETIERSGPLLSGRVVWNVNSTAHGGGVAEMLRSLLAYARGAGIDARWVVIRGEPDFFRVTKRIHNRLHGFAGDGGPLGEIERTIYEAATATAAAALAERVETGDVVLLHDPQTAGMVEPLRHAGAHVIWRCHIGVDHPSEFAREAWRFLLPYLRHAAAYVFSRRAFSWEGLDERRLSIIPPSIDPFSAKNQDLDDRTVAAILRASAIVAPGADGAPCYRRHDGSIGRVERRAELIEEGELPLEAPLVLQVSRWDRLKDPLGVIEGYVTRVDHHTDAHLVLAGPETAAVTDDPEGAEVLRACVDRWRTLAPEVRERIHLAMLPMADADENAAIVNALQRHATVVVQKSLAEGFGLTVAEAMWKARPVVASRIGGIQDQIVDGVSGCLVDPTDIHGFGAAVADLLAHPVHAADIGEAARERVRREFLGVRHLTQYVDLFQRVIEAAEL